MRISTRAIGALSVAFALVITMAAACSSDSDSASGGIAWGPDVERPDCNPLVATQCAFPIPNDFYLEDDETMPTGKRVAFGDTSLAVNIYDDYVAAESFIWNDGFPTMGPILTHLQGATAQGLPNWRDSIELSLADTSPTVIINAETGERVAHFAEIDEVFDDEERRALIIRPAKALDNATRYIVAVRNVVDAGGAVIEPGAAFAALRDGQAADDEWVDSSSVRAEYDGIFEALESAGIGVADLQMAWAFTTISIESVTGRMLHMRDEATSKFESSGISYTITSTEDVTHDFTDIDGPKSIDITKIKGTYQVPLYLPTAEPGLDAIMDLDANGLPQENGEFTAEFTIRYPKSLIGGTGDAPVVQYGHGLLGGQGEVNGGYLAELSERYGYILVATDWVGMASEDNASILTMLEDLSGFAMIPDRLHQGVLNSLMLMKLASSPAFIADVLSPGGTAITDGAAKYYFGNSQGGIMGAHYMCFSTDVERGVLGVPGAPYSILLTRSLDFDVFFAILQGIYEDPVDLAEIMLLMQMLWDRAEPGGCMHRITDNPLPNTPSHQILLHAALADLQVSEVASHTLARSIGAKMLMPGIRSMYGIPDADSPIEDGSSALVEFDYGRPDIPLENIPPRDASYEPDTHEGPRRERAANDQMDEFFRTGVIRNYCDGGTGKCECSEDEDAQDTDPCGWGMH